MCGAAVNHKRWYCANCREVACAEHVDRLIAALQLLYPIWLLTNLFPTVATPEEDIETLIKYFDRYVDTGCTAFILLIVFSNIYTMFYLLSLFWCFSCISGLVYYLASCLLLYFYACVYLILFPVCVSVCSCPVCWSMFKVCYCCLVIIFRIYLPPHHVAMRKLQGRILWLGSFIGLVSAGLDIILSMRMIVLWWVDQYRIDNSL